MTSAPVASLPGAPPRAGAGCGAGRHASPAHWSAAMDHAARAGEPPAAAAGKVPGPDAAKMSAAPSGPTAKHRGDEAGRKTPSRTGVAAGEAGARPPARVHLAHSGPAANPAGFAGLILASGQSLVAQPASAATPLVAHHKQAVPASDGKADAPPPPARIEPTPSEAAAPGAIAPNTGTAAPAHPAPRGGPAAANPPRQGPAAGPNFPAGAPPAPGAPAPAANPVAAPPPDDHGGASAMAPPRAEPPGTAGKVTAAVPEPGRAIAAPISQNLPPPLSAAHPMPASPLPAALSVPPAPAAPEAGPAAVPSPGAAAVPATPAALAAAVLAMHKAGDTGAVLSLDPAGLGSMTVHVSIGQAAQVNVQFVPSLAQTAHLLTSHLDDLRQAMTAAGIALGQTSVSSGGGNAGGQGGQLDQSPRPGAPRRSEMISPAASNAGGVKTRVGGLSAYA